jgi:CRISPR-associated protein Cmr2
MDSSYWEKKLEAYLHDSPDKVFRIPEHETRASAILETLGLQKPNEEEYKLADILAAGIERGLFPEYHADPQKSGSIDFIENPYLTHPISPGSPLKIQIIEPNSEQELATKINKSLQEFLQTELKREPGLQASTSSTEQALPVPFYKKLFLYLHFILRFRLAHQNVGGLGAFWHRIPADSRIPDHSIWHHNALTSALYSCTYDYESLIYIPQQIENLGLLVFTITPVQGFIANARRLRDYWTSSILLSWLAFEGIRWVIENMGPDHILYPSMIDQPLVNIYLEKIYSFNIESFTGVKDRNTIASFPNKFVALIPFKYAEAIGKEITNHVKNEWSKLVSLSQKNFCSVLGIETGNPQYSYIQSLFSRQAECYWSFDWAAAQFINKEDKEYLAKLLSKNRFEKNIQFNEDFEPLFKKRTFCSSKTFSLTYFYDVTHRLVQSALAASKSVRDNQRKLEPGEKCSLCGEFETLHAEPWKEGTNASYYSKEIKEFWERVGKKWKNELDFSNENRKEHLCSLCFMKRGLYKILEKEDHLLAEVFKDQERFPSTTELALNDYFNQKQITDKEKQKKIAQNIHENEEQEKELKTRDRYYAILLMDGDNMGKLVSGETIGSTWDSVLQKELVQKFIGKSDIDPDYKNIWMKQLKNKRLLTPAIHEAISESLGDFSLYCVAPIIENYKGKLIYSGGDDVCAFLPAPYALSAALEIQEAYHHTFRHIRENSTVDLLQSEWPGGPGKISIGLGISEGISISGALLFVHHKENLKWCIKEAHRVLDEIAKEKNGRNSLAIGLYKRSGGEPRIYVRKWREIIDNQSINVWESLQKVSEAIEHAKKPKELSRSLLYRLETYKPALISLINTNFDSNQYRKENLKKFVSSLIEKSDLQSINTGELVEHIVQVLWDPMKKENAAISTSGLIISSFLANQ